MVSLVMNFSLNHSIGQGRNQLTTPEQALDINVATSPYFPEDLWLRSAAVRA